MQHVLHQIWLGSNPPDAVAQWMNGWRAHHPDWKYQLWTDANRPPLQNELAFRKAPTFAMKADILRYELLAEHGGLYVDADFECIRSLGRLAGDRDLLLVSEFGVVTNSIMGCVAGHPLMDWLIARVGPAVENASAESLLRPELLTGPYLVDRAFVELDISVTDPECLLPGDFFFPPRTRVQDAIEQASRKRYATHHGLATWRNSRSLKQVLRNTRLRTRIRRFMDLSSS